MVNRTGKLGRMELPAITEVKGKLVLSRIDLTRVGEGFITRTQVFEDCGTHLGTKVEDLWAKSTGDATTRNHNAWVAQILEGYI